MLTNSKHLVFGLLLIALVFVISGCGDLKTVSYITPPKSKLKHYQALEIPDLETDIEDVPDDALTELPEEIAKTLKEKNLWFKEIEFGDKEVSEGLITLVMFAEITDYQSGTDIKVGGGAIKFAEAAITIQISALDKSTGEEILSGEISTHSSFGFLKKGIFTKSVYEEISEEIAKFFKENY